MADVVAAGDLADRLAVALATFDRALLMFGRFQLAAEFDAATFARSRRLAVRAPRRGDVGREIVK